MAAKHYLALISGKIAEVVATIVSAGAGDDGKIVALDATGKLDVSVLPSGVGPTTKTVLASEALAAGDFVNIYNNAGTANVRKADATVAGKEACGFVLAAVSSGANASVYTVGDNTQVSGMTPGRVYLSTTAGIATGTPPSATGNIVQFLGEAYSATSIVFHEGQAVTLA